MTPEKFSEINLINRIRDRFPLPGQDVIKGIGDDCAVFLMSGSKAGLITTDTLVDSVHFDLSWHPPEKLGRKAAAVNLSDIAAMGGIPSFALLSLALPESVEGKWLDEFFKGFHEMLQAHGVSLVGGDTVKSPEGIILSVTVVGEAEQNSVIYRSSAREDDLVWVGGPLGEAAAGLLLCRRKIPEDNNGRFQQLVNAHLDPEPQVNLGRLLSSTGQVHAMMDLSDGLATDLAHLCQASNVAAEIDASQLPISDAARDAADFLQVSPLDLALRGGEDYKLLFTASSDKSELLTRQIMKELNQEIYCIGKISPGQGVFLRTADQTIDISFQGYDHFA